MAIGMTTTGTFVPDKLLAGSQMPIVTDKVTIALGSGVLARGTVLGRIGIGAASAAAKTGGNTGNGTISDVTVVAKCKVGVWRIVFTAATAFRVLDPDGYDRGAGATGAEFSNGIEFTITAGDPAFVAGDGFDVTVAAGSGKYCTVNSTAVDGSDTPLCILQEGVDATSANVIGLVFLTGEFNEAALVFGGSDTVDTHRLEARKLGIHFRTTVPAA